MIVRQIFAQNQYLPNFILTFCIFDCIIVNNYGERGNAMKYIHRHIETKIMELSKSYPVILITGPRQSGKTTMLRHLIDFEKTQREYVSLDDLNLREMAQNDPALFLQIHKPPILIDEVQNAPNLFIYIKKTVDEHKKAGEFWLTGSQVFKLVQGVSESLAGRVALLHMSPLSQREINGVPPKSFKVDLNVFADDSKSIPAVSTPEIYEKIWRGCMPSVVSGQYTDRNIFYSSYISTYIERDIRELVGALNALKFNRFITAVAARTAQMLNYNAVAEDADIDVSTAKSWMNILEMLGVIFLLYPYSNNVLKRTIKTPKVYFYDTGLVCYLTKWSSPEVAENGAMNGALLENYAVTEIVKSYQNVGLDPFLYYYRDRDCKEIDLIIEGDGKLCPLEIKKTAIPDKRLVKVFDVLNKSPLQVGTGAILCMAEQFGAIDKNNLIVPIWMI